MPHLELGSTHLAHRSMNAVHGMEAVQMTDKEKQLAKEEREARQKKVTYEPEKVGDDPEYRAFIEKNNDKMVDKIDALGGLDKYIKALEALYNSAREIDEASVPGHYRDTFDRTSQENMALQSRELFLPLSKDLSYKKSKASWYKRLLGHIEQMKQSEVSVDEKPEVPLKRKRVVIKGVTHLYEEAMVDDTHALIIYKESDPQFKEPLGYYLWDNEKKKMKGKLQPMP